MELQCHFHQINLAEAETPSGNIAMQDLPKRVVIGSIAVAGAVALAAAADLFVGIPFSGSSYTKMMDILFIVCAGIVIYLGMNSYRDFS